jgi:hypothetical protein
MATKSVWDRVSESFPEDQATYADEYLTNLRSSLKETTDALRKDSLYVLLVLVIFELLIRSAGTELNLGPLKITDVSLALRLSPVLIAYFFYDLIILSIRWHNMETIHYHLMKRFHKSVADNEFEQWLVPGYIPFWSIRPTSSNESRSDVIEDKASVGMSWLVFLAIIAFDVSAVVRLFLRFHLGDIFVWISAAASLCLFGIAIAVLWTWPAK